MTTPPQRVLVTGAGGFIARQVIASLAEAGTSVIATTHSGSPRALIAGASRIEARDVDPDTEWRDLLHEVDAVVHLAARVHKPEFSDEDAVLHDRINYEGTARLAQQIAETGRSARLLFLSTIAVHDRNATFIDENTPLAPHTSYGRSKARAEKAIAHALSDGPSDWTILRPTVVYGPQCPGNMSRLARLIKTGVPLPLGAIHNLRSVLYSANLVDVIHTTLTHPAASRQIFCVADPSPLATPDLVCALADALGVSVRLWNCPVPLLRCAAYSCDVVHRLLGVRMPLDSDTLEKLTGSLVVATTKLFSTLGWSAPYATATGLQAMATETLPAP